MIDMIIQVIATPLGWLLKGCVSLLGSYGAAIIAFTFLTKVILFPLNMWLQKNSIKMVRIHPRLNEIKAEFAGDKNRISDMELQLYKQEHYKPLAAILPMLIQVPIILGLISVVYNPLQHILRLDGNLISAFLDLAKQLLKTDELGSGAQISVMKLICDSQYTPVFATIRVPGVDTAAAIESVLALNMSFLGLDLTATPTLFASGRLSCIPWLSGASAFFLSWCQNRINVLQKEANWLGRWGMAIFLTLFSLYFATLVPAAVGIYWIFGNGLAVLVLVIVNMIYPPKKYIDYAALELSKKHLAEANRILAASALTKEDMQRSKLDYRRFVKASEPKNIVFYSEKSGYFKYFHRLLEGLLSKSGYKIHYITSDPHDAIFLLNNDRIIPYFIDSNRLISLFMLIDADVMVTSLPDLQTFHLKRSYMRPDMEYIYVHHGIISGLNVLREHALDAYDTVFCGERNQKKELEEYLEKNNMPPKNIIECGCGVIEDMYEQHVSMAPEPHKGKRVLIAPSWQADNILESCLGTVLELLCDGNNDIIIRPHPQYIRRNAARLEEIKLAAGKYLGDKCRFQMDFSSNETVYTTDILVTDWSTIAFEYAFSTECPVVFIHTAEKVVNERADRVKSGEQLDITLRNIIGRDIMPEDLPTALIRVVDEMFDNSEKYRQIIRDTRDKYIYHFGHSGEIGAEYIISRLRIIENSRRQQESISEDGTDNTNFSA